MKQTKPVYQLISQTRRELQREILFEVEILANHYIVEVPGTVLFYYKNWLLGFCEEDIRVIAFAVAQAELSRRR